MKVRCENCGVTEAAEGPTEAASKLLAFHAKHPKCRLSIHVEDGELPSASEPEQQDLRITCLDCNNHPVTRAEAVPMPLVPAYVVTHHASHEGHALRVEWGRFRWESPRRGK